jgi:hypothetical protein
LAPREEIDAEIGELMRENESLTGGGSDSTTTGGRRRTKRRTEEGANIGSSDHAPFEFEEDDTGTLTGP